jgi:ABC-type multidrug transport system ATPase subunit
MRHFRSMADHGTTVVLTTHLLASLALFDKVAILARGRLVYFGPPAQAPSFFGCATMARVFDLLGDEPLPTRPAEMEPAGWAERYRCSPLGTAQVLDRLSAAGRPE